MTKRRMFLGLMILVSALVLLRAWLASPSISYDQVTFQNIVVGMDERDVEKLFGPPGWYASYFRVPKWARHNLYAYFDPKNPVVFPSERCGKGWADNSGVIIVFLKDGKVIGKRFSPMVYRNHWLVRLLNLNED